MSKDYNKIQVKNNMEVGKHDEDVSSSGQVTERPKLQSVVGVAPKKVKRSLLSRLVTGLAGPEGVSGIGGYITEEVIKPAIKHTIFDALTSGLNMMFYGDRGTPNRGGSRSYYGNTYQPRTNYNNSYNSTSTYRPANDRNYGTSATPANEQPRNNVISRTNSYGVDDYIITDRNDAAHVLTSLNEYADRYGLVSVADYYDLIKVTSTYTDNSYGWKHDSISAATMVPVRGGGYIIKFPPVEVL